MARTIQSPGVEVKEIDLSLRPNLPVGTTVFVPGFTNQGPTDELLTVTSLTEFEQIYGLPQNAAERYMYHSLKAIFQSPANLLVTRLPYGIGEGSTVADNASVQVFPVIPRPQVATDDAAIETVYSSTRTIVHYLDDGTPGLNVTGGDDGDMSQFFKFDEDESATIVGHTKVTIREAITRLLQDVPASFATIFDEHGNDDVNPGFMNHSYKDTPLSTLASNDEFWTQTVAGDETSMPATFMYQIPEVTQFMSLLVKNVGWDLSGSDRYYITEPSNIELSAEQYQKIIKGEVKLSTANAGRADNLDFNTFDDIVNKSGVGVLLINNKKFIINEKFEGYYVGLSDNTNLNPASDFDSVGKLKTLSKKLGGTSGGYLNVPDESSGTLSRLTFSLSAGFTFDQFGNKKQIGLDGSISEVLENLSENNIGVDEFSDVLTVGVFKIRQSTLEADTNKLDFILADSVVGSLNHFREKFQSSGGAATSYFIESESEGSANMLLKINDGISKKGGNWQDENGMPTKKVRIFPAKDVRRDNEVLDDGDSLPESAEIMDLRIQQSFLNATEENEDRLYITQWQKLAKSDATVNFNHARNLYPHGVYQKQVAEVREVGNIPAKLERVFELADNFDLFPIDITIEGGLGTVYVGSKGGTASFDEDEFFDIGNFQTTESSPASGNGLYTTKIIDNRSAIDYLVQYDTIFDVFKNFCQFQRKDNIFIADPLRYIFVQGRNTKILTSQNRQKGVNFSQHIYWPLRHTLTGGTKNSNFCCSYASWSFVNDKVLNRGVWVPFSGFAAANMGNTDSNFYPWFAPAGFTRGLLSGMSDLAFYPKQKERDQLYSIGLNPVASFPNEGFVIFGQKTMQVKPSAFDRINVRRLFLYLQKAVLNTVKYFVFEPNTLFTRTQVLNVLRPIFEEVKNTQGMYDYLLVCDDRNNTPDVIDRNELVIDIYIKPTRAAEFILVNFYATRTGQDFSELVG